MVKQKSSLAHSFAIISSIVLITIVGASICVGIFVHNSFYNNQKSKIIESAITIDRELFEVFSSITSYFNFLGNEISSIDNLSLEKINQILLNQSFHAYNNANIWGKFIWLPKDKNFTIFPDKLEEKNFDKELFKKTSFQPNTLLFFPPYMNFKHQWALPLGMGIFNKKNQYVGTIINNLNLDKLVEKLDPSFDSNNLIFMLLDENMNFILASKRIGFSFYNILPPDNFVHQLKANINSSKLKSGFFSGDIIYKKFNFLYFAHSHNYPFYFIIGEDSKVTNSEYLEATLPRIIELTLIGILSIVLLYYFKRYIIKPIILLSNSAKKIANGDLTSSIYDTKYKEVKLLANQLEEAQTTKLELIQAKNMSDELSKNLEQIVKERTKDLEEALDIKTELLNSVSHEVRAPIQGITTISKELVEHWNLHPDTKKFDLALAIANNSQRLFSLVSNLLDLAILNEDKMYFNFQEVDIISLIHDIIKECNSLYLMKKNINIIFMKHPEKLTLSIDAEKITQVLRNLLTNSIKFMNSGTIEISLHYDSDLGYIITISDEGMNIPEEELDNIFSPFTKNSKNPLKVGGAGIGLTISKKIISAHNGKIWAKNNDKGISLSFSIPNTLSSSKELLEVTQNSTILMIDDEPTCQMSMEILLNNTGYSLVSAYGGISGLEYLKQNSKEIDLILLDLMMPDMYGLNVLSEIKADPQMAHIPIIIQSGTNDNKEIEKAFTLGAKAYVRKPYQRKQLLEIINGILSNTSS